VAGNIIPETVLRFFPYSPFPIPYSPLLCIFNAQQLIHSRFFQFCLFLGAEYELIHEVIPLSVKIEQIMAALCADARSTKSFPKGRLANASLRQRQGRTPTQQRNAIAHDFTPRLAER
jgi:hypothetical protein